jgi:hypothetical protein
MNDLASSLSDDYPNAPPFHNGDEFVSGLILLAGGPKLKVDAAKPLLELVFGNSSTGDGGIANNAKDLMDSLGAQVDLIQDTWSPPANPNEPNTLQGLTLCVRPDPPTIPFRSDMTPIIR